MYRWKCPTCGLRNSEPLNINYYGSPIKKCKYCNYERLNRKWREIAVDGPRWESNSVLGCLVVIVLLVGVAIWGYCFQKGLEPNQIGLRYKGYYIVFAGILGSLAAIYQLLRIVTGYEEKITKKLEKESEQRMQNPEYVKKLIRYGYAVPEKYRAGIEETEVSVKGNDESYVIDYDAYERVNYPHLLDFHYPKDMDDYRAVKKYQRDGLRNLSFTFVWLVIYLCVVFYFVLRPEGFNEEAVKTTVGLTVLTILLFATGGWYFILGFFGKPKVANATLVGENSTSSNNYYVIVAQDSSKKICYNVTIGSDELNKIQKGDRIDVVTVGSFYKAHRRM